MKFFIYFITWILYKSTSVFLFRIKIIGREHIPKDEGFIMASNHKAYYDPPLVGSCFRRSIYYFAKSALFKNIILGTYLRIVNTIPVKRGTIDRNAMEMAVKAIHSGSPFLMFPEGTRSLTDDFLKPKPGIGMIALQAKCAIVPVYIHNSNRLLDCFLWKRRLYVIFGRPISKEWVSSLEMTKENYVLIAEKVMDQIRDLKKSHFS